MFQFKVKPQASWQTIQLNFYNVSYEEVMDK